LVQYTVVEKTRELYRLTKAKKSGIGQGTGKKGWSRWDKAAKQKSAKRIFGKGTKAATDKKEEAGGAGGGEKASK
jgi:hypothetical protein